MPVHFQELWDRLRTKLMGWFDAGVEMLPNFVAAALVVLLFGLSARFIDRWTTRALERWVKNTSVTRLMGTIARISMILLGLFIALSLLNLDRTVTSMLAGVGVIGLALGFAFQDLAANLISGLFMAFRGHFEVGDVVEVGSQVGTVEKIELRATTIRTFQGLSVVVPNKDVFQNVLVNYTRTQERRVDVAVGVAYSDDLELAITAIQKEVSKITVRDETREVNVFFTGFGASSIDLEVHMWLDLAHEQGFLEARSLMVRAIKRAVDKAGLTIPFPIRTLDFGATPVGGEAISSMALHVVESASGPQEG